MTDQLPDPIETLPDDAVRSTILERVDDGTIPIAAGGLTLFVAIRSLGRGRLRSLPLAALGTGLLGLGTRRRRSAREPTDPLPWTGADEEAAGGPKATSDDAHASRRRGAHGREDEAALETPADDGDAVEFTDGEEPRSKPDLESDVGDPRRQEGEDVEIDVSSSARADEPGEATGPDPEQAQPTRTEATEPEPEPDDDPSIAEADAEERDDGDES